MAEKKENEKSKRKFISPLAHVNKKNDEFLKQLKKDYIEILTVSGERYIEGKRRLVHSLIRITELPRTAKVHHRSPD